MEGWSLDAPKSFRQTSSYEYVVRSFTSVSNMATRYGWREAIGSGSPPSVLRYSWYPSSGSPPVKVGAFQVSLMWSCSTLPVRLVGGSGTVTDIARAMPLRGPRPFPLKADTAYVYWTPNSTSSSMKLVRSSRIL